MRRLVVNLLIAAVSLGGAESSADRADKVVVNKSIRELQLLKDGRVIRSYKIALGRNPVGPKQRQGDIKTPEGAYIISGRNSTSAYHKIVADFVSECGRPGPPGGNTMIHGLPSGQGFIGAAHRLNDWTDGWVAVTDAEIEEIWRPVPDGTPIQINP